MKWQKYPRKGGPQKTYPEPLKRLRLKDMGDLSFWKREHQMRVAGAIVDPKK